ncbi:HNH endonuclease [Pseudomonas sp. 2995-3]|jgi:hypothetical protein|uniref:HNH endonuclease n=1 Tax=Pseudomonas sp. 2995-3 TaxID=1712680 RepID=UPI000C5D8828|nr:HNH endonuclease [Pseudomonas sp. 2995-3]PIB62621.1 hypothetical protein AOA62_21050 [Pseudomonas sp. 2995-3]
MNADLKRFVSTLYPNVKLKRDLALDQIRNFDRCARGNYPPLKSAWSVFYKTGYGKEIHRALGDHLKEKQQGYCCYCQDKIFSRVNGNIEHVLPIKWYPMFAFTYNNLALACATCNAFKSSSDWYHLNAITLLYQGNVFGSYHPNIDTYDDHIVMFHIRTNHLHLRTFVGKTPKGKKICSDLLEKVSIFSLKETGNPIVAKTLQALNYYIEQNPDAMSDDLTAIMNRLYLKI